jgi:hypothetical protein
VSKKEDELEAAEMIVALGEVLNLAASVAELQTTDEARAEIYEVLDAVAAYYGVERIETVVDLDGDSDIMVSYVNDENSEEEKESYIKLAVDNTDPKKFH